jgi:hypothetical protein
MKSLIAIAAITYAIALWIFAPRSVWDKELATAKRNQCRLTEPEPSAQTVPTPEPETIPETIPESIPEPKQSKQSIQTSEDTVYTNWTTTQLRDEAKKRKLNWRPLINGKRKPLNKPQLIQLLAT